MMRMLDDAAVSYHIVLTKGDKVKPPSSGRALRSDSDRSRQASRRASVDLHDVERNR